MNLIVWRLFKRIKVLIVTSYVLGLSLGVTSVALAEYIPPPDQLPPKSKTTSTGPRGKCEENGEITLTVLAPAKTVGQTVSLYPTFAWFVSASNPLPLEFRLFAYGQDSKLIQKISLQSSPGIMKISLPEDKPGLSVGQRYLWQVAVLCNPNHPSADPIVRAEFQVVEMSPALKSALSATKNPVEMTNLYARAGLWYDALGEALRSAESSKLGQVASTLLEDLAKLEEPPQSDSLRQIASRERQ
jgi:hypothetical protein